MARAVRPWRPITATPAGRMVFTVLGAVAELERSLIVERVKAGLRNAKAKGKRLGRPRVVVDAHRVAILRAEGHSRATIAERLGIGEGTAYRAVRESAEIPVPRPPVSPGEYAD
jgi:DNA invertase Pin-like site-specific DNA recombinase